MLDPKIWRLGFFFFVTILLISLRLHPQPELPHIQQLSPYVPLSSSSNCEQALSILTWTSTATTREFAEDVLSSTSLLTEETPSARAIRAARRLQLLSEKALAAAKMLRYEVDRDDDSDDENSFLTDLDNNVMPSDSSVNCYLQNDSSDLCVYDTLCVDIPSDTSMPIPPTLLFIKNSHTRQSEQDAEQKLPKIDAEALKASITRRSARQQKDHHSVPMKLTSSSSGKSTSKLSWDFEDIIDEIPPGEYKRNYPFGSEYVIREISPEETIPKALGGKFDGSIVWMDDFYLTTSVLSSHLWGSSMSIFFPLLGAAHANRSLGLHLPPIRNLILTAAQDEMINFANRAWIDGNPWKEEGGSFRWAWGFLEELLDWLADRDHLDGNSKKGQHQQMPYVGSTSRDEKTRELDVQTSDSEIKVPKRLKERLQRNFDQCRVELTRSVEPNDLILGGETLDADESLAPYISCLVLSLSTISDRGNSTPYRSLLSRSNKPGTRLIFTSKDLPDDAIAREILRELQGLRVNSETMFKVNRNLLRRPHRVCARKAIVLGPKELLIGGQSEASLIRSFSADRFGTRRMSTQYIFPPTSVLFLDRGEGSSPSLGPYGRFFDNVDEMKEVLAKYTISYSYVTDTDINKLSFVEQGRLFGSHGVLITPHGAGMVNAAFMPPRSSILEIHPYHMWCPIYSRGLTAAGHHVFSLTSHLKGRNLDYAYLLGRVSSEEIRQNAEKEAARCEVMGNVKASTDGDCWMSYKTASIRVPIAEFEHKLLLALEAVGDYKYPISSPIALLEGEEEERGEPLAAHLNDQYYQSKRWKVCPPQSTCA